MSSSTIYSNDNQTQSSLITSVTQLQLVYDDLIKLPMTQNNIKTLLNLLNETDSEIVNELTITLHEIRSIMINRLKRVLIEWHMTNSLTVFDSFLFHSIIRFLIKINFSPNALIKPIEKCLNDIEQHGKYLIDDDNDQQTSLYFKDFSKLIGLYTDDNEQIMRAIIQCLCSKYYFEMFHHQHSSGEEFLLITCPIYWMNYKGPQKEEMAKSLLNTLIGSSDIHHIIEKYHEQSSESFIMLLDLLNYTINSGESTAAQQILLTDMLLSSVLNKSSLTIESMMIMKSSFHLLLTLIKKNHEALQHVRQNQYLQEFFQNLNEIVIDIRQILDYLQTIDEDDQEEETSTIVATNSTTSEDISSNRTIPIGLLQSIFVSNQNIENKEEITLIYYDKNINCDEDVKKIMDLFQQINDYVFICTDYETCLEYINQIQTEKIILILSDVASQDILDDVHKEKQVYSIYIFCIETEKYDVYLNNTHFYKINGIYTEYESLLKAIQENIFNLTKQLQAADLFNQDEHQQLGEFSVFRAFKQVLLNTKYDKQMAKQELIDICRDYYRGNEKELKNINDFERTYQANDAIRWYTNNSFVYRLVNKALRTEDYQTFLILRFYITDLCESLSREYDKLKTNYSNQIIRLYRGQQLTPQKMYNLKLNVGKKIATNGFLSTSRSRAVALRVATNGKNRSDVETIMIEIEVDTSKLTTSLADIASYSSFTSEEEEVLFDLGASFTIQSISYDDKDKMWCLKLLSVPEYVEAVLNDCKETDMSMLLGELLYKLGQYSKCRMYFENLLKTYSDNHRNFYKIHEYIGRIFRAEDENDKAIVNCTTALDGYVLSNRWEEAATVTFYIGLCYGDKGDKDKERIYLDKAYRMFKSDVGVPDNYHELGWIMSAYGNLEDDNDIARNYFMKALKIFENPFERTKFNLNDRDQAIAQTWKNLAGRYSKDNNEEKELECLIECEKFRRKHITTFKERKDYTWCLNAIYAHYSKQDSDRIATTEWGQKLFEFLDSNLIKSLYTDMPDVQKLVLQRKIDRITTDELNTLKILEQQAQPLDYKNIVRVHMNIGLAYMKIKDRDWARRHFLKAFELSEIQLEVNTNDQAECFYDIGNKLIKIEPEKSLEFLNKSLIIRQIIFEADDIKIGDCYKDMGTVYFFKKLFDTALEYYNKALSIYEKHLNNNDNGQLDYGNCLSEIGRIYERQGNYEVSIEFFLKAVQFGNDIIGNQPCFLCSSYNNLAIIYDKKSEVDLSIAFYEKFLEATYSHIAQQSCCTANNHTSEIFNCLVILGNWYMNKKQFDKAIENYKQGIFHLEKYTPNDYTNICLYCYCVGDCYDHQKQYTMAIEYYKKAMDIYEQYLPHNRERRAVTMRQMSFCYTNIGKQECQNATNCILEAINIFERYYPEKKIDIAQCYLQYSVVSFNKGEYKQAIDAANKSLQLQPLDQTSKIHTAFLYLLMAGIYYKMFEYEMAFNYTKRAMEIYENPNPQLNNDEFIASIYHLIGVCLLRLNRYDEALIFEKKSYKIRNNILPAVHEQKADSHATLAFIYSKKHDYANTEEHCERALKMCENLIENQHKTETLGRAFETIGELYFDQHQTQKARQYYEKSLQLMKEVLVTNHSDIEHIQKMIDRLSREST